MLEYEEGRTELKSLGKFALVERLTDGFDKHQSNTLCGVGDDCAVIACHDQLLTLATTNTLVEGIDFDMSYTPLRHLGYKAVAIAISNIAAMNGTPQQVMISVAISNRYSVEALEELYAGIRLCCNRYDVDLVGGDTSTTQSGMVLTATVIGQVDKHQITYRSGAKNNDLICVSGDLGSAYSGLLVLEREKINFIANPKEQPDLDSYDYVLERFLKPEPRMDIVQFLHEKDIVPTSMIDVSNGLASEMLLICQAGHCGCNIYEEKLPIDYQTTRVCSEISKNMMPVSNALNGGSDYELLFTIAQSDYDKVKESREVHIIGHITDGDAVLVTPQNTTIELRAQGFQNNDD
ncbi:MAG: thiamine-phosphate kinase [Bacteroidales bacterium]|nr:thiamine-phosphate kinase [Candidatus Colimorpha onthohippi]